MTIARLGLVAATLAGVACAPRYRTDLVGRTTTAAPPGRSVTEDAPVSVDLVVADASNLHHVDYRLITTRATAFAWRLTCPGETREGRVGETIDRYRERRAAELRRDRERQARLIGDAVGAIAPSAGVAASVEGSGGSIEAGAEVSPGAAAEAIALENLDATVDPRDVGPQDLRGRIEVQATEPGRCRLALWPDPPGQEPSGVSLELTLAKLTDLRAERRAAREAERARRQAEAAEAARRATSLRVAVRGDLVAAGADPLRRDRERAEERRRREQAERAALAARRAEERARAQALLAAEERRRAEREARRRRAVALRGAVIARLVGDGHGDYHKRTRERAEEQRRRERDELAARAALRAAEARRRAAEARRLEARRAEALRLAELRAAQELRLAEARAAAEEQARQAAQAALSLRADVKLALRDLGAVDRPSRPAPPVETRPAAPHASAVWIDGTWTWDGGAWVWIGGRWELPPAVDVVWIAPIEIVIGGATVRKPGRWIRVRDHQSTK